jgi:excisionase family DNA binding protein
LTALEWTPRQVGILLGLSEATVKRMIAKGALPSHKRGRGWRTSARTLLEPLRAGHRRSATLHDAALAADDAECLAQLIEQRAEGRSLGALFDELLRSAAPLGFIERAQPLAELPEPKTRRIVRAALLESAKVESRMAACLFRARRVEVLTTLQQLDDEGAAALVQRARPEWFWAGKAEVALPALAEAAAQTGCRVLRLGRESPGETSVASFAELERLLLQASWRDFA